MSSRPFIGPYSVVTNGSMNQTIISKPTIITNVTLVSYSVSWSGSSPVGVVTVQASNDYTQNADGSTRNQGTWNTIVLSNTCNVSGNTGVGMIDIDSLAAYAIRLVYTPVSGGGSLQASVIGKVA